MAIYIKPIPTLTGRIAERFAAIAQDNEDNHRGSIDFSKQIKIAREILRKSNLSE